MRDRELTILVLSCRRLHYLTRTIEAARHHFAVVEPELEPTWVCFDNGSSSDDRRRLEGMGFDLLLLSGENLGQGPALNHLIATVRTPYFLLLEEDWVVENPSGIRIVREALGILDADANLGQVKLDGFYFVDFADRSVYDGPFRAKSASVPFYVQNPRMQWGGFTCPPAVTRTEAVRRVGPFTEEQPLRRWWAESDYSARFARHFHVAKSPALALFKHIGDEPSPGWAALEAKALAGSRE